VREIKIDREGEHSDELAKLFSFAERLMMCEICVWKIENRDCQIEAYYTLLLLYIHAFFFFFFYYVA
jgi:hypothetical protein